MFTRGSYRSLSPPSYDSGNDRSTAAMLRILATVLLFAFSVPGANGQDARGTLRITVALRSADGTPLPVPRHVLLISDNPPTAPPRRVQTALDGTASVRLPPGNYTIESDQPVTIDGTAFQWMQIVDIAPGTTSAGRTLDHGTSVITRAQIVLWSVQISYYGRRSRSDTSAMWGVLRFS